MDKAEMDLRGARILVVDDTEANLDVLCKILEAEGYRVAIAPNGQIALRIADRIKPELALLDVMMPGMDGFEVCRRLKKESTTKDIPVIFVTGQSEIQSVVEGFQVGGVDYIVKPYKSEEVLVRVRTHLKIDRLARNLETSNQALRIANREIREATQRKSRFMANMSHEVRTPITAIMGFTDLVLKSAGDHLTTQQKDNLSRVRQSADRLLNLISDILDLSKIEAGRSDIRPRTFQVGNLVASCCEALNPLVRPGVRLLHEVAEGVGEAHTDVTRLQQILTNLLSNALKFTESGEVRAIVHRLSSIVGGSGRPRTDEGRGTAEGEMLEIAVSDTGIGIPPEALEYIFEEFQQVAGSAQKYKGTGLGLAITKRLVELLGGTIEVQSTLGKGSTFKVKIPLSYEEGMQDGIRGSLIPEPKL